MQAFSTIVRIACRLGGIAGMLLCGYALIDPSILPATGGSGLLDAVDPHWRAVFGLLMSVLVFSYGLRPHAHRERPVGEDAP